MPGHDPAYPEHKRQKIQHGRADSTRAGGHGCHQEAQGQVKAPLQEVKAPPEDSKGQAGRGELVGNGSRTQQNSLL